MFLHKYTRFNEKLFIQYLIEIDFYLVQCPLQIVVLSLKLYLAKQHDRIVRPASCKKSDYRPLSEF